MPRQPNAVDFWRGFALISIFIDHIPGIVYANYTPLANFSIADAADLFVFLAGWSLRLMAEGGSRRRTTGEVVMRLFGRAFEIYTAQILITMLAVAILAASAMALNNPLLLQWHNAAAVFDDPVRAHIGLAILSHHLGYFDILPLYVVLMTMAPAFATIDRLAPALLLPLSLAIYLCALAFRITLPSWPVSGSWFFNPLAWQLIFVLGFVLAKPDHRIGHWVRRHIVPLRAIGVPVVIFGVLYHVYHLWPDPTKVPEPKLFFISSKAYDTPMRLIQFLALVAVFSGTYRYIRMLADFPALRFPVGGLIGLLALLGRHSLYVFCVGSLLSLSAQVVRYVYHGSVGSDTAVVILGIAVMAFTAWLVESRSRTAPPAPAAAVQRS
jgi:hypothetical protein